MTPAGSPCPVCRKPSTALFNPFCSKRCSDVDLSRWLNGAYEIPGEPAGEEDLAARRRRPERGDPD